MRLNVILLAALILLLAGCHEEDYPYFHLITADAPPVAVEPQVLPPVDAEENAGVNEPQTQPGEQCIVKGNITRDGRKLYHIEGMPNFNQVVIDIEHSERCFDDEESAIDAGWIKAGN